MTEAVLDASVVLKWFRELGERHVAAARAVRAAFERGQAVALAPPLLFLEILNVAGRRWQFDARQLDQLARGLPKLGFQLVEPELPVMAQWISSGLSAYDAAYVAVAQQAGVQLITDDLEILSVAPALSSALADYV